jgi:dipeptidyl aminopeptidase/acylaminoacyl peptidase
MNASIPQLGRRTRGLAGLAAACVLAVAGYPEGEVIAPNENLVAEGIPPVPTRLAATLGRYTNSRAALLASWNPGRREMLISTRFGDVYQIHLVRAPGGARRQLTFYPDNVELALYHPAKGDYFIFSKDVGGAEFYQLYRYDLADGGVTLLTDGTSRNVSPVWDRHGDTIAYGSTRRDGSDVDLWTMDPSDPKSDRMVAPLEGGGWAPLDWSPDRRTILVLDSVSVEESSLWLVDAASGAKTRLTPGTGAKVSYLGALFSRDGRGVYVATDQDAEVHRLAYIDLAGKTTRVLTTAIPWDVGEFDLSDDGRLIALAANEDGFGVLHLLSTATGQELPLPSLPRGVISNLRWHPDNRDLGFNFASARSSGDVYSLDVTTGAVERWTESETGGLVPGALQEPELVHWTSWDGRSISGLLYRPPSRFTGPRPVIIDIHGGPEGQARPAFIGRSNFWLNELGIALIDPNVRGSTGYGKTFVALDNGLLREGAYRDIDTLLDWIHGRPDLDPGRVMVAGGSYGGFMSLEVATHYSDRIRCSVDVVGPSNLVTYLEHTSGYRRDLRRVEYGDERDPVMRAFFERIAPANNTKNITKPLFIVAGKNDPRIPVSESEQMLRKVRENGTPVWWLLGKNEGHGFTKKQNSDFQFYATVLFVEKFLLD